ncbi:MAG: Ig-like domain-containing protein [Spirochaetaceae bacterium]|nr:Ig-like domain-containing protein [Spirochaetaceae bacterium]
MRGLAFAGLVLLAAACDVGNIPGADNNNAGGLTVTVTPPNPAVPKGTSLQFTAAVSGDNNPAQTVTWSILEPGRVPRTTIGAAGILSVAADETLTALTVRAAFTFDTTKYGQTLR